MTWDRGTAPEPVDVTRAWIEHHLYGVHTAMPCRVQSYDPAQQTADLVPLVRHPVPQPDGSFVMEDLPVLPCVPVVFPRAAGHFIAFGISEGDFALAIFCEGAIGHWWAGANGGDVTDPGDLGRHHLSNAVCIPGLYPLAQKLRHAPARADNERIRVGDDADDGTRVTFFADRTVKLTQGTDVVIQIDPDRTVHVGGAAASQFVALANLVNDRLETLRSAISGHTHAAGSLSAPPGGGVVTGATGPASTISTLVSVAATKAKAT